MSYLDSIIRRFLLSEGVPVNRDIFSHIQIVSEILENKLKTNSVQGNRFLEIAKQHIHEIKRSARKLNEEKQMLEEKIKLLEEEKIKTKKK